MKDTFELKGTAEENFKKLEIVMRRVFRHLKTKTYGIIPSSVMHSYTKAVGADGLVFRACMFKGVIRKILFKVGEIEKGKTPAYECSVMDGGETRMFKFETKRLSYSKELNVALSDGAVVEIRQMNPEECEIHDVYLTVLLDLDQDEAVIIEKLTDELLNEAELE